MVEVNLLPWREYMHAKQKDDFKKMLIVSVFVSIFLLMILHIVLVHWINKENHYVKILTQQLAHISQQSQAIQTLAQESDLYQKQLGYLKSVKAAQIESINMFNTLASVPAQIVFGQAIHEGLQTVLFGIAQSSAVLSQLVNFFPKAQLVEVKNQANTSQLKFQLQVLQNNAV